MWFVVMSYHWIMILLYHIIVSWYCSIIFLYHIIISYYGIMTLLYHIITWWCYIILSHHDITTSYCIMTLLYHITISWTVMDIILLYCGLYIILLYQWNCVYIVLVFQLPVRYKEMFLKDITEAVIKHNGRVTVTKLNCHDSLYPGQAWVGDCKHAINRLRKWL